MPDRPSEVLRFEHADMRDDVVIIAGYEDLGIGPAVVFDGGGFMDPERLRAYAADLVKAADWLAEQRGEQPIAPLNSDPVWLRERLDEAKEIIDYLTAYGAAYNLPDDLREQILDWHNSTFLGGCTTLGPDCACNPSDGGER